MTGCSKVATIYCALLQHFRLISVAMKAPPRGCRATSVTSPARCPTVAYCDIGCNLCGGSRVLRFDTWLLHATRFSVWYSYRRASLHSKWRRWPVSLAIRAVCATCASTVARPRAHSCATSIEVTGTSGAPCLLTIATSLTLLHFLKN